MSKSSVVFVASMLIVAACSVGLFSLIMNGTDEGDAYEITYVLDGGINNPDNPKTYRHGDRIELMPASKDGHIFYSWFDRNGNPVHQISPSMYGDITLYADWNINLVGRTLTFDLSGTVDNEQYRPFGPITGEKVGEVSGTYVYTYLEHDIDKGYCITYEADYIITDIGTGEETPYNSTKTYWTSENDSDVTWFIKPYQENITYKGATYPADVYWYEEYAYVGNYPVLESKETQWLVDDWMPCRIETKALMTVTPTTSVNPYLNLVYSLTDVTSVDPTLEFEIRVFGDEGITTSGSCTCPAFDPVKISAVVQDGTEFVGWYTEGGTLLSTSKEFTIPALSGNMSVYAVNSVKRDVTLVAGGDDGFTRSYGIPGAEWSLLNEDTLDVIATHTGETFTYDFNVPGIYILKCFGFTDGVPIGHYLTIFSDGYVDRTFEWKDNEGHPYELSIDIKISDYLEYSEKDVIRNSQTYFDGSKYVYSEDVKFVTFEDKYIVAIANEFKTKYGNLGHDKLLDIVLTLTQTIPYQYDDDYTGQEEYWKFPLETLYENGGDCEDTSFLFCAIVKAMGYDTALLLFTDHMASAVTFDGQPDGHVFIGEDGGRYLFCETTATGYVIGKVPPGYSKEIVVMVVPDKQ